MEAPESRAECERVGWGVATGRAAAGAELPQLIETLIGNWAGAESTEAQLCFLRGESGVSLSHYCFLPTPCVAVL